MGLNCKPGQLAWIDPPKRADLTALGLEQLRGHVVRTERLIPALLPIVAPSWEISPHQSCVAIGPLPPSAPFKPGDRLGTSSIPDAWLRPFKDLPPEEIEEIHEEVQQAIACRD